MVLFLDAEGIMSARASASMLRHVKVVLLVVAEGANEKSLIEERQHWQAKELL